MGLQKEEVRITQERRFIFFLGFYGMCLNEHRLTTDTAIKHIHPSSPMLEDHLKAYPCRTNEDKEDATCTNDQ